MTNWLRRQWHTYLMAYWNEEVMRTAYEQDVAGWWKAIDRREFHEAALLRVQGK
jgi:hypothetical protein